MVRSVKLSVFAIMLALMIGGCAGSQGPSGTVASGTNDGGAAARRFQDSTAGGRTTMESAIELSEKYARLSDQAVALREDNQRLTSENQDLHRQLTALEGKLKQTQKELGEANALLIEMLTELNNWKSNILGFRGEMREASRAQLEALLKVLEILGGEAEAGTLEHRHAEVLNAGPGDESPIDQPSKPVKNEPNAPQQ
jgi:chromosome segregation ATPase